LFGNGRAATCEDSGMAAGLGADPRDVRPAAAETITHSGTKGQFFTRIAMIMRGTYTIISGLAFPAGSQAGQFGLRITTSDGEMITASAPNWAR